MIKQKFLYLIILIVLQGCYNNAVTPTIIESSPSFTILPTVTNSITPRRTPTITNTMTPSQYYSPLPKMDISNIPTEIVGIDDLFGFSASDVEYLLALLRRVAKERDPSLLVDFILLPMHVLQRCPGNVIETPGEFIYEFLNYMDDTTRYHMMNLSWKDVFIKYDGMGIKVNTRFDIWFAPICRNKECDPPHHIIMVRFFDYGTYWDLLEGHPTPEPTYNPNLVKFGEYHVTDSKNNFIENGSMTTLPEQLFPWKDFKIQFTNTKLTMGPFQNIGDYKIYKNIYEYCNYKEIEVCQPDQDYKIFCNYSPPPARVKCH
jgi:hypothetical protein